MERGELSGDDIRAAAELLYTAEQERHQVRPTSVMFPEMALEDAYRIQNAWVHRKIAEGRSIIGRKVGLTSRAMQQAMQIDEPNYGTLLDDMQFDNGGTIEAARFSDPRVQVELAFVLREELPGPELDVNGVLAATEYVIPVLEITAARSYRIDPVSGKARGILDTIADNAASAGVVMGERVRPEDMDLRWVGAILSCNDVVEETGLAAAVLNHPANGVIWLARRFAAHDVALEPGEIILAGSFTRPVAVAAGDRILADYGPLGSIRCQFE